MNAPIQVRRPLARLALFSAATLALGLFLPVGSTASQAGARAEERATRAEERSARREQERTTRLQEREARVAARAEERTARRHAGPGESGGEERAGLQRVCKLTLASTANRITVGETVTLVGKLLCPSGVSAAEAPLTIYRREHATALALLATTTTAADGSFQLTPAAFAANSSFTVRAPEAPAARAFVKVAPRITLDAPSASAEASAASGRSRPRTATRATFTGTVSPLDTGALVALQVAYVASGERWRSVAFGRVGSDGSYSIAHAFRTPGAASIRTIVHGGRLDMAAAISEPSTYVVPQPQNPRLTIQTSADPIAYGQSVTISGVAAGADSQPVSLLARTDGSGFTVVAKGRTDASGHYTFTQEPLQRTHYRVTDATAQSTALFESVEFALRSGAAPNTAQAGQQLTLSGTVAPAHVGQVVYLERAYASGIGFHVIDAGTVDVASRYTFVHSFETAATSVMRIKVPTDGERDASTGAPFTVTVTP